MCPTAMPRSSTTLVRSARVGAGPLVGRWEPLATGVFVPELGCDMTSAYDSVSDSVSEGASQAASRLLMILFRALSGFSQKSWWSSMYLLMTSCWVGWVRVRDFFLLVITLPLCSSALAFPLRNEGATVSGSSQNVIVCL